MRKIVIDPRVIKHLGRDLITSPEVAIIELIKNRHRYQIQRGKHSWRKRHWSTGSSETWNSATCRNFFG